MPWQSGGRICSTVLVAAIALLAHVDARAQAAWAHQNGSLTPSGALVIKSLAGGSYTGTQNPVGALAKSNQAAATQPATVVIQATNGGYGEAIPLFFVNGAPVVPPTCPSGYTAAWKSTSYPGSGMIFNVAGTRFSYGLFTTSGSSYVGWLMDGQAIGPAAALVTFPNMSVTSTASYYAGTLCTK